MEARLELQSDPEIIGAATDFAFKWGLNAGLPHDRALRLALTVDELVTNIVRFAFRHEQATFTLIFQHDLSKVTVIARELGEPFDPERHQYQSARAVQDGDFKGAGLHLIQHFADKFTFLNRGRTGKEFRIVYHIPDEHIAERLSKEQPAANGTADDVEYVIVPATPADAEDIAKLVYHTYGYTYAKEALYFPDKTARALRQGDKFGVLARTLEGDAVGSFAVLRSTDSEIGEVGEAVVLEGHRRRGLMTRMLEALIQEAERRGLKGAFGEAVTVHTISQRVNQHFGMHSTALLLAAFRIQRFKGFADDYPQPVSVMIDFRLLVARDHVTAYLPEAYADLLRGIYADLGVTVTTPSVPSITLPPSAQIDVRINYRDLHATIVVEAFGADLTDQVQQTLNDLRAEELHVVFVDLPLDEASVLTVVPQLRELGFVFAGLMPLFHHERDYLRLQHPFVSLDFALIYTHSDRSHELKQTINEELAWTMTNLETG
jgi:anti-sigma regulatory factor (Ser/Thr protein kinase)/GNAT superfamily N-acetyltransferase